MMSSTVLSFKNYNASQSQITMLDISIKIKTSGDSPPTIIETKKYNEKTAGDKESHLLLFEVILWWS